MLPVLKKISSLFVFVFVLGLLTGISALTAYYPVAANIPINIIVPVLVLIFGSHLFFERLKLSTLIIGRLAVVLAVFGVMPKPFFIQFIIWMLRINILEAVLTDLKIKKYWNVLSGVFLLVSSVFMTGRWVDFGGVTATGFFEKWIFVKGYYLIDHWDFVFWALAYTLWNWIFVLNQFSRPISFFHTATLASPLLMSFAMFEPGFWLITRSITITLTCIFQIVTREALERYCRSETYERFTDPMKRSIAQMYVSLSVALLCGLYVFFRMKS